MQTVIWGMTSKREGIHLVSRREEEERRMERMEVVSWVYECSINWLIDGV